MKPTGFALLLLAVLVLVLVGCKDNTTEPVAPRDQYTSVPAPLAKVVERDFTWLLGSTSIIDPGMVKPVNQDNKLLVKKRLDQGVLTATFTDGGTDLLSGDVVAELNGIADFTTMTADFYGKLTLTPTSAAAEGGSWEFSWHGKATFNGTSWILPLKEVGHGNGGALTGMQVFLDHEITAAANFSAWTGVASGYIVAH